MFNANRVVLAGSERTPLAGANLVGPTDPSQLIEISVILKHRQTLNIADHEGQFLTHAEFALQYGARISDLDLVKAFAQQNDLQVLERGDEIARRTVTLAGTASAMEKAFSVELHEYEHPEGTYRGRTGAIQIPAGLQDAIQGIFGLDDRPAAKPHIRYRAAEAHLTAAATSTSYTPNEVAKLYDFPTGDATGETIAILELGGGYKPADLKAYFKSLGLTNPKVKTVSVDHGKNRPTNANSADGEVMLDIEVAAAVAQGAKIVVYFCPNTDQGFQDGLSTAIHDQTNKPCVISISWGGPESSWTKQAMTSMDQIAAEAAALGITITVASGDNGSSDGVTTGGNHVDFPASSPHVLATGGTLLIANGNTITQETVWNNSTGGGATGGGYSAIFKRPTWQSAVVTEAFRGVPDVAGNADPNSGYAIRVDGEDIVVGGTSAVAPLWAGLIALLNKKLNTRLGFINPKLYSLDQATNFHDITVGNNGTYPARPGWDAATGLGSPNGNVLSASLQSQSATSSQPSHAQTQLQSTTSA